MKTKKKLLLLFFGLLLTFLLPNYAMASLTGDIPDGAKTHAGSRVNVCYRKSDGSFVTMNISKGRLKSQKLHDGDEYLINNKCGATTPTLQCPSGKVYNKTSNSCVTPSTGNVDAPTILDANGTLLDFSAPVLLSGTGSAGGTGTASVGAVYKYDNVITLNGVQVDALVKVTGATNSSITTFDRANPNNGSPYTVSSGASVADSKFFAPEITTTAAQGRIDFLISFQDISGNPVTLLNVYGNTIDIDGMGNIGQSEFVEYGGFASYEMASNTDLTAQVGSDGVKRKFVGKGGYGGLTLNDVGRVQTKFDSISTLEISMGSTWNSGYRLYGSAFVKHNLTSPVTNTPPTVNSQTTSNTRPPITGGKGSSTTVSVVVKDSASATVASGNATVSGTTWTFTPATALLAGNYDVFATGSNGLVDQSDDELTILLTCTLPNVINAAGTACVPPIVCTLPDFRNPDTNTCITPTPATCPTLEAISATIPSYALSDNGNKVTICHLTSSKTNPFNVITISTNALNTHLNNHGDYFSKTGACPTDAVPCPPMVCTAPYTLNAAGDACVIQDVSPTVTLGQTATDYAVPVITGGVFGTSTTLTITVKNTATNAITTIGTATKTASNGWTVTGTANLVAGTYDVIATGDSGLVDGTLNELIVSAGVKPTVTLGQTATDYAVPVLTGTFGTSTSLTITVKNTTTNTITTIGTVTKGASDNWTVTGTANLVAGTYDVIATGDAAHGGLVDTTPNELTVSPSVKPTVTLGQTATDYAVPVITGGVFGTSATLTITVKNTATNAITTIGTATKTAANGWTVTGTVNLVAGTYDVIATGDAAHGTLVDITLNELVVSAGVKPTVDNKTTTDKVAVPLTGTAGSSTSLIITVKNASNAVVATSPTITPTGSTWTYTPPVLAIGTYNVVATGDAAHGSLVDISSGELVVSTAPIPTVTAMLPTTDTTPVITGTVGTVGLSAGEAFSVKVNNVTYNNGNAALVIATTNWTLTIPTALNVGKYDVDAVRGTGAAAVADVTSKELEIIGTRPTVANINQVTNDTTPVITGGFGGIDLGANEAFSVTVNGIIYNKGDGNLVALNSLWTLTIPPANALKVGDYEVKAVRNLTLEDLSSNELHIAINPPTVESQKVRERLPIVIKGTVGDVGLDATSTFTVTVNSKTYTYHTDAALAVSGTVWTLTIPTTEVFPAATYEVVATRDGTLVDGSSGELIIEALSPPTVESQTTFDTTPIIKGTVGDVALSTGEVFTVLVNGVTYTAGDGKLVVSTLAWTLTIPENSPISGSATPYPVTASRTLLADTKTGTGNLTITPCVLPKVVNAAGTECINPTPTVVSQPALSTSLTVTPTITGTVGEVALGSTETFVVTVNQKSYPKGNAALVISGMNWTLTIPATDAIPVGTYDVEALRNNVSKDKTAGELIVNLACVAPQVPSSTRTNCVSEAFFPAVDTLSTDDSTPVVTGKVGESVLGGDENFTVEVNGMVYQNSQLTISGLTWSLEIPLANKLTANTYEVVATRNDVDKDKSSNELTIKSCDSPKRIDATTGDCSQVSLIPTVTPSASHNVQDSRIVVEGTVGDVPLTTQERTDNAFIVTVTEHGNSSNTLTGALTVSGTNWTFQITTPKVGTFDVNAARGSEVDITDSELVITGNVCCIGGVTTQCPTTESSISVPNYTGECDVPVCPATNAAGKCTSPLPDPDKEETLPSKPENKVPEAIVPPAELGYCDDGGKRSYGASTSGVTIKRARIANAETTGGTFESNALVGMKVIYGTLTAGSYDDTDNSCQQGYCTNKTITGATLTGAIVDIANDYIDAAGNIIDTNNRGIALKGGVTNPESFKKDGVTKLYATITSGMITAGTDTEGNPVRGSITNGLFASAITHGTTVLTKGRRTQGTLTNATISGATITTVDGDSVISVVGCDRSLDSMHTPCTVGIITSGTMEAGAKTFGTVENGTLTNATITGSNHCFSSGTVGSKGQLNWKEVIKQ
jgi:hypothetical protein